MREALSSSYNSLQVSFRQNYSHGVTIQSSYSYSKAMGVNGAETEGSNGPREPFDYQLDYGPLSYDRRQNWVTSFLWEPTSNLHFSNGFVNALVKGWGITGILTMRSGTPFTVRSGLDNSFTGIGSDTPDQVGRWQLPGDRSKAQQIQQWFNPNALVSNAIGTFGQVGIGSLRNPGFWNWDTAFQRTFTPHEGYQLEFRAFPI